MAPPRRMSPGSARRARRRASRLARDDGAGIGGFTAQTADQDAGQRSRSASRPRHAIGVSLLTGRRAQGMPGAGRTHGPPANKMQAAGTTGSAETSRHSPRDGLHAYTQSPWCAGLVGHHARQCLRIARDTSIGVSGPCDFTSASDRSSAHPRTRCDLSRPSHPHLACRDDRAQRPFRVRRDAHRQS